MKKLQLVDPAASPDGVRPPDRALSLVPVGVAVADRRVDVQRQRDALAVQPVDEAGRVGIEVAVPVPAVPRVRQRRVDAQVGVRHGRPARDRRLEVGVDRDQVERHPLGAEAPDDRAPVAVAVGPVAREPDAEGLARQQRRRRRSAPAGRAARGRSRGRSRRGSRPGRRRGRSGRVAKPGGRAGEQHRAGVVEQVPAVAREQALVQRAPARPGRRRRGPSRRGCRSWPAAGRGRGSAAPACGSGAIGGGGGGPGGPFQAGRAMTRRPPSLQQHLEVGRRERPGPAPVAKRQARGADDARAARHAGPEAGHAEAPVDRGQRRAVLEAPVSRVLEPDQGGREDLEARVAVAHHRALGGIGRAGRATTSASARIAVARAADVRAMGAA